MNWFDTEQNQLPQEETKQSTSSPVHSISASGLPIVRAPAGGITINGKFYKGGWVLPGTQPPGQIKTHEQAAEMVRLRKEHAASALRKKIRERYNEFAEKHPDRNLPMAGSSAEVIGETGAMLFEDIVLNPGKRTYPRDRLEAWEKLGKQAEILKSEKDSTNTPAGGLGNLPIGAADRILLIIEYGKAHPEILEGIAKDVAT